MKNAEKFADEFKKCIKSSELCKMATRHNLVTKSADGKCNETKTCLWCHIDTLLWLAEEYKEEIENGTLVWVADELLGNGDMPHINIRRYRGYENGKHWCYVLGDLSDCFPWKYVEIVEECQI